MKPLPGSWAAIVRQSLSLTQRELAEILEVSTVTISTQENARWIKPIHGLALKYLVMKQAHDLIEEIEPVFDAPIHGAEIVELRRASGETQTQLAKRIGVTAKTLGKFERTKDLPARVVYAFRYLWFQKRKSARI